MSDAFRSGDPVDERLPWVRKIHALDSAWADGVSGHRMRALERAGRSLGDALRSGGKTVAVQTFNTSFAPYPVRFAFNGAVLTTPGGLLFLQNRSMLVQVKAEGRTRNILFNPLDPLGGAQAPFFRQLADESPGFFRRRYGAKPTPILNDLAGVGLSGEDIDLIAFDHFHVLDLRPTMTRFPNALLLAPKVEWNDWDDLHPLQAPFYVANGKQDIDPARVVFTQNDLKLGEGALLLRTPGHSTGNQTLFVHTDRGIWGTCENGTSADCWAPAASRMKSLRRVASFLRQDIILNTNTPEYLGHQYDSMVLERSIVDRVPDAPEFVQMLPSSEVTPHWIAPHIRPSMVFGGLSAGAIQPTVSTSAIRNRAA